MKNKVVLMVASILMVAALLLTSCGPRAAPAPAPTPVKPTPSPAAPVPTPAPAPTPTPASSVEKPKYGGTFTLMQRVDIPAFVPGVSPVNNGSDIGGLVYEKITGVDWSKGPAGTGETSFGDFYSGYGAVRWQDAVGELAESFETPEIGVWILNIRKGVRWALDPKSEASRLANGREMTADDVIWSINWFNTTPNSSLLRNQPGLGKNTTVEKTGPWQVTVKTPVDPGVAYVWMMGGGSGGTFVWPKEVAERYWKTGEWQNTVGTGPYMLTDYVPGSVATFVRNPNYWRRNPVGPGKGDQLPYPDGLKIFIVPDVSTRLAVMRTGKADRIDEVQGEDAQGLLRTNPRLQSKRHLPYLLAVGMRTDKPDLPYKDIRVRQALHLATDFETIKNDLYRGQAEILTFPVAPARGTEKLHIPLEELSESAKTLYKYNPERAKQLLAEAGYPSGFKAKIIVSNTTTDLDVMAVLKAMWVKVGVDLEIQPREAGVLSSIRSARSHEEMLFTNVVDLSVFSHRYAWQSLRGPTGSNPSVVNDPPGKEPTLENAFQEIQKNIMVNWPKADQIIRGVVPYIVEQAYYIVPPAPYTYRLWQPWLKNHYGESRYAYYIPYVWIDHDLKEQMTGRR